MMKYIICANRILLTEPGNTKIQGVKSSLIIVTKWSFWMQKNTASFWKQNDLRLFMLMKVIKLMTRL